MASDSAWPQLEWGQWGGTATTLHRYLQVLGKIQLALSPGMAQWQQASLRITGAGISSQTMNVGDETLTIWFDLRRHQVRFEMSDGRSDSRSIDGCSVAEFWFDSLAVLQRLGADVKLDPMQQEIRDPLPCDEDTEPRSYDPQAAHRFLRACAGMHRGFQLFRSRFWGKQTETSFWWGGFDIGVTRYSGRPASAPAGTGLIYRTAMDAEQHEIGFWPGDEGSPQPVFYAYTYPRPDGIELAAVLPAGAYWSVEKGEFLLPYDAVRAATDPTTLFLDFAQSTYAAGATLAGWDRATLERQIPFETRATD